VEPRSFAADELAAFDGTNGSPTFVAYNGKVYDVSGGSNWVAGSHYQHGAGQDLTEAMEDAPHCDDVMDRFPIVGKLSP
jgi:predicted heme/steroid binding protein